MVYPAAVTPFLPNGSIDMVGVAKLLAWYKANECDGVVLGGTNGEGPSLSAIEKRDLVRTACGLSSGLRVILGIASNSIVEAKWLCRQAAEAGAEAVLVMPPAYFRDAGQAGLIDWYTKLLEGSEIPLILYNMPKRVQIEIEESTLRELASHPKLLGIKDSSGNRENLLKYSAAAPGKKLFVGDETLLVEALDHGWTGTISGAANIIGKWLKSVIRDYSANPASGQAKLDLILPGLKGLRNSPQPFANKETLTRIGVLSSSAVRTPLIASDPSSVDATFEILRPFLG